VSLTEAGKVLLDHAGHIVARLAAAKADLDAMAAGDAGVLRVGTFQSASNRLLPPTLALFRKSWPDINVELRNEPIIANVEGLIRSGQADLAFADMSTLDDSHAMVELIRDPEVLITAPDHPLAQMGTVDLADLADARMISMPADDACATRIARALERVGVEPHIVFRSDDNLTTQRLVAIGLGVAIVPLLTVERSIPDARVAIRGLNAKLERQIGIIWHRDRLQSRAAEAFIETALQVSSDVDMPVVPSLSC
jgi:DNA-binding transcriptional LysR family regulator